ncbi:hypothetical protein DSO57_1008362 [Entomophthora muscae]|uniref:Uncharacterized protein n=1 Tax=Entomophthora muscae TaxID=34485 RepID=A0ACC2RY80_9FUNG|nr:hypothetical protein DSO57_1008362 [Entomophthora muscae]
MEVKDSNNFSALNLKEVKGNLIISKTNGISVTGHLEIGGRLSITNSKNFFASNLIVKKILVISKTNEFSVTGHLEIGGHLSITDSSYFSAPNLKKVPGSLKVDHSDNFYSPSMTEIGKDLEISRSDNFSAPNLKEIKGNLKITDSVLNNHALFSLKKVKNMQLRHQGSSITFNGLKSISSLEVFSSSLVNITGIDVDHLDDLILKDCPNLSYIPLKTLKSLNNLVISASYRTGLSNDILLSKEKK